jgi:endonuclease YncB( thermonuclease family)
MVNEIFCGRDVPRLARTPFPAGLAAMALSLSLILEAGACEDLSPGPQGRVTEVVDGDTVMLEDGLVVRMIGTQAPKLPLGREGFETWPLAEEAKAELSELVLGETVALGYGGERRDRYDRALAHVFVLDGAGDVTAWAQEHMVANGLARVYSFPDNRRCLEQLFAAERQARADRLGIWSHPYYSLRDAARPETILAILAGTSSSRDGCWRRKRWVNGCFSTSDAISGPTSPSSSNARRSACSPRRHRPAAARKRAGARARLGRRARWPAHRGDASRTDRGPVVLMSRPHTPLSRTSAALLMSALLAGCTALTPARLPSARRATTPRRPWCRPAPSPTTW